MIEELDERIIKGYLNTHQNWVYTREKQEETFSMNLDLHDAEFGVLQAMLVIKLFDKRCIETVIYFKSQFTKGKEYDRAAFLK